MRTRTELCIAIQYTLFVFVLQTHLVVDNLGRVQVDQAINLSWSLNGLGVEGRVASGVEGERSKGRSRSTEGKDSDGLHDECT